LDFENALTDDEVSNLCRVAYENMDLNGLSLACKPLAMSALLTPSRKCVTLSSSMCKVRGEDPQQRFNYSNEDLRGLLARAIPRGAWWISHRTGACGELNACSVWLKLFPGQHPNGCSTVRWGREGENKGKKRGSKEREGDINICSTLLSYISSYHG
jgi:hypothetical protein